MASRLEITVLTGVSTGDVFRFSFEQKASVVIGRDPGCELVLQDPLVSRRHAMIELSDDSLKISDLGSSHGTIHMGFHIEQGAQGARLLHDGDEFKIGESIFRVHCQDSVSPKRNRAQGTVESSDLARAEKRSAKAKEMPSAITQRYRVMPRRKKILYGSAAGVLGLSLIAILLIPENQVPPKQKSDTVMSIAGLREEVVGFIALGNTPKEKDLSHRDKAQFYLPAGDVVIEYDFRGDAVVEVFIDESFVARLEPSPEGWQQRELIVRDILIGKERKLIFDNKDFPFPKDMQGGTSKHWGVRNIRVTPVVRSLELTFSQQLAGAITLAEKLDNSADGPYIFMRGLQETILGALFELNQEAVDFAISREGSKPDSVEICTKLGKIQEERASSQAPETLARHQQVLLQIAIELEGELWRGIFSRLKTAERAAKLKNYIQAHDTLLAAKAMFADEGDYRWVMANRMLMNKKIVPKMVRERPEKFRKGG